MDFAALIAFGSSGVKKVVDFVSLLLAKQFSSAIKQATAWAAGIAIAFVVRESNFAGAMGLSGLDAWSTVLAGLLVASAGSVGMDVIKAVDNTQSATIPPLSMALFKKSGEPKAG